MYSLLSQRMADSKNTFVFNVCPNFTSMTGLHKKKSHYLVHTESYNYVNTATV